jgi:hypothetical protein
MKLKIITLILAAAGIGLAVAAVAPSADPVHGNLTDNTLLRYIADSTQMSASGAGVATAPVADPVHPNWPNNTLLRYIADSVQDIAAAGGTGGSIDWKTNVVAASTANLSTATDLEAGDTLDTVTLSAGDRVLLKNQSTASQNGIYLVSTSGAASRATDFDAWSEIPGSVVSVTSGGATNASKGYICTAAVSGTVGSTGITFAEFGGSSGGTPGGSNTQVQFNDSSAFGGDAGLTYNKTTDVLTASGGLALGSGATLNFNSGNVVLTHSSGVIGVTTGDLRITTAGTNATSAAIRAQVWGAETDVASASTTDLGAAGSSHVRITGTTTITGFGTSAAGVQVDGRFSGALTLTYNATSMILQGGQTIITRAGDMFQATSLGSGNWYVRYQRFDGSPLVSTVVETLTDAAPVTPDFSKAGGYLATVSQTTTFANPGNTASAPNFWKYVLRIKSSSAQTISFGSKYKWSDDMPARTATSGSSKVDYLVFIYDSVADVVDVSAGNFGFTRP